MQVVGKGLDSLDWVFSFLTVPPDSGSGPRTFKAIPLKQFWQQCGNLLVDKSTLFFRFGRFLHIILTVYYCTLMKFSFCYWTIIC